jgi:hypothetical protein
MAQGKLIFGIMASLAEFEWALMAERVKSSMMRAKAQGKHLPARGCAARQRCTARMVLAQSTSSGGPYLANASPSPKEALTALLSSHGPLWIRGLVPAGPHIRVVRGCWSTTRLQSTKAAALDEAFRASSERWRGSAARSSAPATGPSRCLVRSASYLEIHGLVLVAGDDPDHCGTGRRSRLEDWGSCVTQGRLVSGR